jgi:hypothetical protein
MRARVCQQLASAARPCAGSVTQVPVDKALDQLFVENKELVDLGIWADDDHI